jgi:SAM-dependent methyltransferase
VPAPGATPTPGAATTPDAVPAPGDLLAPVGPAVEDVAARLLAASLGAQEIAAVHAGDHLGWYRALARDGASTARALAERTATHPRYVREWLEHQAAAGYLVEQSETDGQAEPRYALTAGAAEVLADPDALTYLAPLGRLHAASGRVVDELHAVYRTGGGVSWARLGDDARQAQAAINRPFFLRGLADLIAQQVPDLHARLLAGARVVDVGCGEGWSAIGLAQAYPRVAVVGVDLDAPSVSAARTHAAEAGLSGRVRFVGADVADPDVLAAGPFDVATAFECVHDMADPVAVLTAVRALAPTGWVLVADERVEADRVAPAGPLERWFYGFSLGVCLPDGLSRPGGVGTGTVMRPATLDRYARAAGFAGVEVLDVEHDLFRFYRLHP